MSARIKIMQGGSILQDSSYEGAISVYLEGDCTVQEGRGSNPRSVTAKTAKKTAAKTGRKRSR